MDVLDAIMKIFADIFAMNNYAPIMSDLLIGGMTTFFQGFIAFFQVLRNMYEILAGL